MAILTLWDWLIIALYLALSMAVGLWAGRKARRSTQDYFLGGRNMGGWLAGLSLVATTFAADTPLAVTELVRTDGIAGNWLWWNQLIGAGLTTFFFARLWRRAGVVTDLELLSLRYSGPAAAWLRGLRAVYLGGMANAVVLGWVNLALMSLLQVYFGLSQTQALLAVGGCLLITALYSTLSGLMGVVVTDALQFVLAMACAVLLAVVVLSLPQVGGLQGLRQQLSPATRSFWPSIGSTQAAQGVLALGWGSFMAYVFLRSWASWYPGAEPGGGGYVAQRLLGTRNEKQAIRASLIFNLTHYALRPWPWIIVALASLVLYPTLTSDHRLGYVYAMRDHLPAGLQGLMLAGFLAAYMSTAATHLNWGASYLLNDLYKPYLQPRRTEQHYVRVAQVLTALTMLLALAVSAVLHSIKDGWEFLLNASAGMGGVLIARWFWWRVNAWAELAATLVPLAVLGVLHAGVSLAGWPVYLTAFPAGFTVIVAVSTLAWVVVALLTPPTEAGQLRAFCQRVQPRGWWGPHAAAIAPHAHAAWVPWLAWLLLLGIIYGTLAAVGQWLLGTLPQALIATGVAGLCTLLLVLLSRRFRLLA